MSLPAVRVLATRSLGRTEVYRVALRAVGALEARVEQADALDRADLVVRHGWSWTAFGAVAASVPAVVLPLFAGQFENGCRIADEMAATPSADQVLAGLLAGGTGNGTVEGTPLSDERG